MAPATRGGSAKLLAGVAALLLVYVFSPGSLPNLNHLAQRLKTETSGERPGRTMARIRGLIDGGGLPLPSSLGRAPPAAALPPDCTDGQGLHIGDDLRCYFGVANLTRAESETDPRLPYCWGDSGDRDSRLLFHTAAVTGLPNATVLLLHSFFATQCCDAVMWFWLPPGVTAPDWILAAIPPAHAHRIVWKPLVMEAEWAAVADDFPYANASTLAAMAAWEAIDLRFYTDWIRLLLMYRHGGIWVDIDTVFLRDHRPLFSLRSMGYRAGIGSLPNNAYLKIAQRPEPMAHFIMEQVLLRLDPRPDALGYILTDNRMDYGVGLQGYKKIVRGGGETMDPV